MSAAFRKDLESNRQQKRVASRDKSIIAYHFTREKSRIYRLVFSLTPAVGIVDSEPCCQMACLSDLSRRLTDDGYQWLMELGGLTGVNSKRFRETILSLGICTDLD